MWATPIPCRSADTLTKLTNQYVSMSAYDGRNRLIHYDYFCSLHKSCNTVSDYHELCHVISVPVLHLRMYCRSESMNMVTVTERGEWCMLWVWQAMETTLFWLWLHGRQRPLNVISEGILPIFSCIFLTLMSNPLENYYRAACYATAVGFELRG